MMPPRRRPVLPRTRRSRVAVALAGLLAVAGVAAAWSIGGSRAPAVLEQPLTVDVGPEADGTPVSLDAVLVAPDRPGPHPAVLLAHGFGGSRADVAEQARALAERGYVVLAWTARGFGRSGGLIHLNSPDYEVADGSVLIDLLAQRDDVVQDAPGDPRVGIVGGSYGGAFALLTAGYDPRVDAIAPRITWHDLSASLFPQYAAATVPATSAAFTPEPQAGVFKRLWAGVLFGGAAAAPSPLPGGEPTVCGRFAPDVCQAYAAGAASGKATDEVVDLLRRSSPSTVLDRIEAPTLLVQGQSDSLFPLAEGDANAAGIAADGTPVKLVWFAGGHDGGDPETERLDALTLEWFDRYLARDGSPTDTAFEVTGAAASFFGARTGADPQVLVAPAAPGVGGAAAPQRRELGLTGAEQVVVAPAGGNPAQVSSLPGLGAAVGTLLRGSTTALPDIPGQSAAFETAPAREPYLLVGSATVDLTVSTDAPDVTLFARLLDVAPDGTSATLPNRLVTTVRLDEGGTQRVRVVLPAVVREIEEGHSLRVVVGTTDQGYAMPSDPRTYRIALAGEGVLSLPEVPLTPVSPDLRPLAVAAAVLAAVLAGWATIASVLRRRRRRAAEEEVDPDLADVPLVVEGLGKAYAGGLRAVTDVSFRVERGHVLGLLGPNGAGKTTVLRMLMGLIHPTEGRIRVFGHRIGPGAPVLSRMGAFVEGPGLLPHLSGRANLELYWRATGRPLEAAHLDTVLEVAGLGDDVDRRVRTYSQGMRQRLAIAQAMLGLPELLVLDEPTNGLDPPQIREMREVLRTYARTGRTVLVSSHLLAEVERTCTHVVVMNRGRVVAAGPIDRIVPAASGDGADGRTGGSLEDVFLSLIGAR